MNITPNKILQEIHQFTSFTHSLIFTELDAYGSVVSALRAQGDLTKERRKVLQDLSNVLNVSPERHKTEVRRAVNDEVLATVSQR